MLNSDLAPAPPRSDEVRHPLAASTVRAAPGHNPPSSRSTWSSRSTVAAIPYAPAARKEAIAASVASGFGHVGIALTNSSSALSAQAGSAKIARTRWSSSVAPKKAASFVASSASPFASAAQASRTHGFFESVIDNNSEPFARRPCRMMLASAT